MGTVRISDREEVMARYEEPLLSSSPRSEDILKSQSEAADAHRQHVQQLPDLTGRIKQLGLSEEYLAFKDRYLAWRQGKHSGARGEITVERLTRPEHVAANRGFGFWYPTVREWVWKRTMSYWIAVTFFEGSIFFTVSSFMYNEQEVLREIFYPMTLYGYCAGKVLFFICTYLMCLETVNFNVTHHSAQDKDDSCSSSEAEHPTSSHHWPSGSPSKKELAAGHEDYETFYWWPYRYQTASRRLIGAGATPLPYITSIVYFTGVLLFTVGLVAELLPGLPVEIEVPVLNVSFMFGALMFTVGGFTECIQNRTFTSLECSKGWWCALGNLIGGSFFFMGACESWFDAYDSQVLFGIGSVVYMLTSSLQIVMWKDEQFGLTFLAVLNNMAKPGGLIENPVQGPADDDRHAHFSMWGALFVHICCFCGAASTYNFNVELARHFTLSDVRSLQLAFNEFLPCLFAHMMLLLTSAVMRTPKAAPFRQMYTLLRYLCVAITINSAMTLQEFVTHRIQA